MPRESINAAVLRIIEEAETAKREKTASAQKPLDTAPSGGTLSIAEQLRRTKTASTYSTVTDDDVYNALRTFLHPDE